MLDWRSKRAQPSPRYCGNGEDGLVGDEVEPIPDGDVGEAVGDDDPGVEGVPGVVPIGEAEPGSAPPELFIEAPPPMMELADRSWSTIGS